jgi:hypothetical protein
MVCSNGGRIGSILILGWVLAAACSSQGGTASDAGSPTSDTAICNSVPMRLLSKSDAGAVRDCSFALTIPSNGYDEIRVFEDESLTIQIPASAADGWTYSDASTLLLTGSYCDDAIAGKIVFPYVVFACHEGPTP